MPLTLGSIAKLVSVREGKDKGERTGSFGGQRSSCYFPMGHTHGSLMSCFVTENCSFNSWETIPKFKLNLLHMDDIKKKKKYLKYQY